MFRIVEKKILAPSIKLVNVSAPEIAARAQPGQFIILRIDERGERIPLTIADSDQKSGTLTLIFREVGRTTVQLGKLNEGDYILDVVGPLGKQFEIDEFGKVICVGGGVGVAPIYPVARALKRAGNEVISVIGARSRDYLILVEEMKAVSDRLFTATDDGSAGQQGCAPDVLKKILEKEAGIGLVVAIGPLVMMKAVAELTRSYQIKTVVSLNPIMVDGTGMCGACRVTVGGETKFACVDGPGFDGHLVDWPVVIRRARMFRAEEKKAMEIYCTGSDCLCRIR